MVSNNKHESFLREVEPGRVCLVYHTKIPSVLPMSHNEAKELLGYDPPSLLLLPLEKHEGNYRLNGKPPFFFGSPQVVEVLDTHLSTEYVRQHLPPGAIEAYKNRFPRV